MRGGLTEYRSLISVIVPCYNAARWVKEAIDSCLQQTYERVEVIVVDDGSTDHSLEILQSYGARIRLETGPHRGGSNARNCGFALSTGRFIQFLDADDYLLPQKIERQVSFLEETDADAVYGDWRHQYHKPDGTSSLGQIEISGTHEDVLGALLGGWWTANMTLLLRREIVAQCGGWDETLQVAQDRDFFISVAMTGADIRYQPGCLSIYRRYGNVTVSTANLLRWLENHQRLLQKAEARLAESGRLSIRYRQALARSHFHIARNYYDLDRSRYAQSLQKTLSLSPNFSPNQSAAYNLFWRIFGFAVAERLASYKRRVRRKLG